MKVINKITACLLLGVSMGYVHAQTAADAQAMVKSLVSLAKTKGLAKAAEDLNGGTDPLKCKERPQIGCFIFKVDSGMIANAKNPKMVGQDFPADFADVDGTPIVSQVVGPFRAGKTAWEAKYKFAPAGSKKIVPNHSFCEKIDAGHFACATLVNPPQ